MKPNAMDSGGQIDGQEAAGDVPNETEPLPGTNAGNWNRNYAQLEAFYQSHGHWRVDQAGEEFRKLTHWLIYQSVLARGNLLPPERREKLERLQVIFDLNEHNWEEKFAVLTEFHARYGHVNVPRETPELFQLNNWLKHQSNQYRDGTLSPERRKRLRQLGWKPRPKTRRRNTGPQRPWNQDRMFAALEAFKKRFGHCRVPDRGRHRRLGAWLAYYCYRGRRQNLTPEMRERLLQLGVTFTETLTQRWERMFASLQDYVNRFGDWRVPSKWPENPDLASWTRLMWRMGKNGKLPADRYDRLAALGVAFDQGWPRLGLVAADRRWEKAFEVLRDFHARHGHSRVPYHWPENQDLAKWLSRQLRYWRAGALKPDRQKSLRSLGIDPELRRGTSRAAIPAAAEKLETCAA